MENCSSSTESRSKPLQSDLLFTRETVPTAKVMLCLGDVEQGEPGVRLTHNARKFARIQSYLTLGPEQGGQCLQILASAN